MRALSFFTLIFGVLMFAASAQAVPSAAAEIDTVSLAEAVVSHIGAKNSSRRPKDSDFDLSKVRILHARRLESLRQSGHHEMLNLYQTKRSKGANVPFKRWGKETLGALLPWSTGVEPASLRPKYAYLDLSGNYDPILMDQYGEAVFEFRQEVKARTTFTRGDSYDNNLSPRHLNELGAQKEFPWKWGSWDYMEAQIWGRLSLSDVARVLVPESALPKNIEWLRELSDRYGFEIATYKPEIRENQFRIKQVKSQYVPQQSRTEYASSFPDKLEEGLRTLRILLIDRYNDISLRGEALAQLARLGALDSNLSEPIQEILKTRGIVKALEKHGLRPETVAQNLGPRNKAIHLTEVEALIRNGYSVTREDIQRLKKYTRELLRTKSDIDERTIGKRSTRYFMLALYKAQPEFLFDEVIYSSIRAQMMQLPAYEFGSSHGNFRFGTIDYLREFHAAFRFTPAFRDFIVKQISKPDLYISDLLISLNFLGRTGDPEVRRILLGRLNADAEFFTGSAKEGYTQDLRDIAIHILAHIHGGFESALVGLTSLAEGVQLTRLLKAIEEYSQNTTEPNKRFVSLIQAGYSPGACAFVFAR